VLSTFLSDGLFNAERLGGIRDLSNASLATGSATHALWIPNKNVAMSMSVTDAKNYITEMSLRIARKLALVPFLDYDHASDEDNLSLLMLSMVQAGFVPLASEDKIYDFFEKHAPLRMPLLHVRDLPPAGREHKMLAAGEPSGCPLAGFASGPSSPATRATLLAIS
jgi:hypothetical protein